VKLVGDGNSAGYFGPAGALRFASGFRMAAWLMLTITYKSKSPCISSIEVIKSAEFNSHAEVWTELGYKANQDF